MTPSTTNTAAREVVALIVRDVCETDPADPSLPESVCIRVDDLQRIAEEHIATLTHQQGGEQEVAWQSIETAEAEFLTNLADKGGLADPVPGMLRHCARLIAGKRPAVIAPDRYETEEEGDAYAHGYVDGEDAALRTKQPAASEGDGKPLVPPCDACGGRGCIDHGDTEIGSALFDCEECDGSGLANTSKQAAGEAVLAHEPMVPRKDMKRLYNAYVRLLESGRDRIRDLGGECDGVDVMERNDLDLRHARDVLTTPPRHPADEGRDAWTKEAPTESGWYWHDDRDAMRLHYVFTRPGHAYLCTEGEPYGPGQKRNFQAVQKMGGVWSGPVNPPTRAALHPGATK